MKDSRSKIARIAESAQTHFEKKEHFLILVDDEKAALYVDELLWKLPSTSFLPHVISDTPCTDWIAISKTKQNVNQARVAFNLCASPLLIEGPFRIIYDFEDLTAPSKQALSTVRFDAYKSNRWIIEARS